MFKVLKVELNGFNVSHSEKENTHPYIWVYHASLCHSYRYCCQKFGSGHHQKLFQNTAPSSQQLLSHPW